MTKLLAACLIAILAGFAIPISAQEKPALRLVQTIPLPGVKGRLDHMGIDLEKKRGVRLRTVPRRYHRRRNSHPSRIRPPFRSRHGTRAHVRSASGWRSRNTISAATAIAVDTVIAKPV